MSSCCNDKTCEIEALRARQSATLRRVLAINAVMFVLEFASGLLAGSVSLLADSLDMLGDATVYGFSLYAVAHGARQKAFAALLKGGIMAAFGLAVLAQAIYKMLYPQAPAAVVIGGVGLLALLANGVCLVLLWRHRTDDINMSSVWLCSRNDIVANVSVLGAAFMVWSLDAAWPDIVVGVAIAALFLRSAVFVLRGAATELRLAQA